MTIKEAKKTLEDIGLTLKLNVDSEDGIDKSKITVTEQTPKQGIKAEKDGYVMCDIQL
ncbi:MAG: PASTA domain-containing protein [Clostridia bacterium]|nr:PASTA domain-containing protein [Clostridia bacterium]